jgi:hypothetical protein
MIAVRIPVNEIMYYSSSSNSTEFIRSADSRDKFQAPHSTRTLYDSSTTMIPGSTSFPLVFFTRDSGLVANR